jgi:hypothetical protein
MSPCVGCRLHRVSGSILLPAPRRVNCPIERPVWTIPREHESNTTVRTFCAAIILSNYHDSLVIAPPSAIVAKMALDKRHN